MDNLQKAIKILKSGGIIIYPTDTLYGIGCDATNKKAVEKLFKIKKRDKNKPVSICASWEIIEELCIISDSAKKILKKNLPGKLTGILGIKKNTKLSNLAIKNNTVGARIPNHPFVLELLKNIDFPIIASSANISGEPSPARFKDIKINADFKINGDDFVSGNPSTIIDFTKKPFKILRQGGLIL